MIAFPTSVTISFRCTFILECHYRRCSAAAFSFGNGNRLFYFFRYQECWYSDVGLYHSAMSFRFVISPLLIKLSHFIFCISFLITAPFDYLSLTATSVWLGSIADYQPRKMCVKAYKHPARALKHTKLCEQRMFSFPQSDLRRCIIVVYLAPRNINFSTWVWLSSLIRNLHINILYIYICLICSEWSYRCICALHTLISSSLEMSPRGYWAFAQILKTLSRLRKNNDDSIIVRWCTVAVKCPI